MENGIEKTFNFKYDRYGIDISHQLVIPLPSCVNIAEIAYYIFNHYNIPPNLEDILFNQLSQFVKEEEEEYELRGFIEAQERFIKDENIQERSEHLLNFDKLLWNKSKSVRVLDKSVSDEKCKFHEKYHRLIHSGFLTEPIIFLDHSYRVAVQDLVSRKLDELSSVCEEQADETEKLLRQMDLGKTDEDVNRLSLRYFNKVEALKTRWDQSIHDLQGAQKKEFRDWIHKIYEDFVNQQAKDSLVKEINERSKLSLINGEWSDIAEIDNADMEESFTINLSAQLKSSHNLRLRSMQILDMCDSSTGLISKPNPHRIQTAMSLYSNSLSGLILLVDNRINSYTGIKKEFSEKCLQSTDFHFPDIEEQLSTIRLKASKFDANKKSIELSPLKPGDFYITRHSNLSQVHVVFHLVIDESIYSNDVSSRHSVILGLRNILKVAHWNDINTISIPLLLIHELSDDITLNWCLKRAELVLKCVKGFMIEMASFSPTSYENKTIQFIVPKGVSTELFSNLTSMLSSIFRISNPLVLKSKDPNLCNSK
ncbi:protein C12orf4 homolog [Tetranychus urticae]|uniref:Uncharacterized protein n=1 Tax=Tetranychus urticae TaxID=32264 RepID=T1KWS1_TETUR|nr:protein C12orf4 homolog [Tetranychus urticae]